MGIALFLHSITRDAQVAELVDALVSNTSGVTRAGSTPALGTTPRKPCLSGRFLLQYAHVEGEMRAHFIIFAKIFLGWKEPTANRKKCADRH